MAFASVPCWLALALAGDPVPLPAGESEMRALAARCGSQIEWIEDGPRPEDTGTAFAQPKGAEKRKDLRAVLGEALSRAKAEQKLVLWHVYRFQGGHMYRAAILDDYMDQVLWSDPELVRMARTRFVPLRTQCSNDVGREYGLGAWDDVEPALVFLAPDGKLVHQIDRIRTFDPRWFAEVFRRVLARHPEYDREPAGDEAAAAFATLDGVTLERTRASYYEALGQWLGGDENAALEGWRRLCTEAPESPFAWRAAANLIPAPDKTWPGAARHSFEWPFETWLPAGGELPTDTRWRRTPADAESVAENAVRWLLRTQRADGSWNDSRYAYWDTPVITPNAWMAITALAAAALCDWRDLAPAEIDAALLRADDYLFRTGRVNAGKNEECYACAYRLLYVEKALANTESAPAREELLANAQEMVDRLVEIQSKSGQWAHEYDNAFCTGVVLDALARARQFGAQVPQATVDQAAAGLLGARLEDGSYVYGGLARKGAQPGPESAKDSCGRSPICEGALVRVRKGDAKALGAALANYQKHWDRIEKVAKCDFHTDGELAGFFFFHDLYHSSEAARELSASGRKLFGRWFLEKLTSLPEVDGSFLDDHEIGKSCSTAYALLALKGSLELANAR